MEGNTSDGQDRALLPTVRLDQDAASDDRGRDEA